MSDNLKTQRRWSRGNTSEHPGDGELRPPHAPGRGVAAGHGIAICAAAAAAARPHCRRRRWRRRASAPSARTRSCAPPSSAAPGTRGSSRSPAAHGAPPELVLPRLRPPAGGLRAHPERRGAGAGRQRPRRVPPGQERVRRVRARPAAPATWHP